VPKGGPSNCPEITPEQWARMCAKAKQQWEHALATDTPFPINMGR
jgi:hypothetical protein